MARAMPRCGETNEHDNDDDILSQNIHTEQCRYRMNECLKAFLPFLAGGLILIMQFRNATVSKTLGRLSNENDILKFKFKSIYRALIDIKEDFSLINQKVNMLSSKVGGLMDQQMGGNNLNDYALKAGGSCVLKFYNTKAYDIGEKSCSVLGHPVRVVASNSVDTILQPSVYPGDCWAMRGSKGNIVIKLSTLIQVENVTLEHIHKSNAPLGDTTSAPHKFSVWGLESEKCDNKHLFGFFCYDNNGPAMQTFPVKYVNMRPFRIIELEIHSNHGNPQYTCIYRLRIHGKKLGDI